MSGPSKGLKTATGGVRQTNKPKFDIPSPPPTPPTPPPIPSPKGEDEKPVPLPKSAESTGEKNDEEITISLDVGYFEELKNYKPKYETHKQITVRIPAHIDAELNKIARGKKGAKQELITRGIEREIALIKMHEQKLRENKK